MVSTEHSDRPIDNGSKPFFSVIIPTRDRPDIFDVALDSVMSQTCADIEIIVIDDGSHPTARAQLDLLKDRHSERVDWIHLHRRVRGHGHPFARNQAVSQSAGRYICTLDDDDLWIDGTYLARAKRVIEGAAHEVDIYFSNQVALYIDGRQSRSIWLGDLGEILQKSGQKPDADGVYSVTIGDLLATEGFSHLNNMIVRREIYDAVGGMDESLRYEPDRDLYLRIIDRANNIKFDPTFVSHHNVPDQTKNKNVSTSVSSLEKILYQLYSLHKITLSCENSGIKEFCKKHIAYSQKKIAEELATQRRYQDAAFYARQAFGVGPTFKWGFYTLWLMLRRYFV